MTKPKYRRLTYDDRRVIENMCKAKKTQSEIANAIGVSQSTISRELSRNPVEGVYAHGRAAKQISMCNLLIGEGCGSYEKWRNKVIARNECENDNL